MRRWIGIADERDIKAAAMAFTQRAFDRIWRRHRDDGWIPRPGWTVHTVRRRGRKINWHDPNDIDHEAALIKVQEQVRELIAAMEFARTHGTGPGRRDLVLGEERP